MAVPGFVRGLAHAHKKYGSGHVGATCCNFADLVYKVWRNLDTVLVQNGRERSSLTMKQEFCFIKKVYRVILQIVLESLIIVDIKTKVPF